MLGTARTMRLGCVSAVAALLLAAGGVYAQAGFTAEDGTYVGVELSIPEKAAVNAAIAKLQTLTDAEANAQNKATMQRVIECLKEMLKNKKIGKETGTSTNEATTQTDGLCVCKADAMNIDAPSLAAGEPACSNLADSLMHEGIHTLQWAQVGSPFAGTEEKEEWVAYSWGKYVLAKLLMDPNLSAAERAALEQKLKNDCIYLGTYCASAATQIVNDITKAAGLRKRSAAIPSNCYQSTYPHSGRIEIENGTTGAILRTLDTSFALRSGLAAVVNTSGREVVFAGATDALAGTGAIVMFTDLDGDGLVEQGSRTIQTLGGGVVPLSMEVFGSTLWVLARNPGGSSTRQMFYIPDTTGDGVPDVSSAIVFASGATMPTMNLVQTFRVRSLLQVTGSGREPGMSIVGSRVTHYTFTDLGVDHVADTATSAPFDSTVQPFIPVPIQSMVATDTSVVVRVHPTAIAVVVRTDALGNQLDILGTSPGAAGMARSIPLIRPLNIGEFIVLRDQNHGLSSPIATPFLVGPPMPEILGIAQTEVMPGQPVQLMTRFVNPGNVQVRCSGVPANILNATPTQVVFLAPTVGQKPSGHVVVELVSGPATSLPVGLLINGDCNSNGIADLQDVNTAFSRDVNLNSVPDECECMADFNGDGFVRVGDIFDFLGAWFAGDPTTRYNGGNTTSIQDIFDFLAVWFAGCN